MKRFVHVLLWCCFFKIGNTQTSSLLISTSKTTSLVFPFAIRHVDRGTKDVLVQRPSAAENVLLVKAATENFSETNLSVLTDDGALYSFTVNFNSNPSESVYHLSPYSDASIASYSKGILDNPLTVRSIRDRRWDMEAAIIGIYIKENTIYYQLRIKNSSSINYDIDQLRFTIKDKTKSKRTAVQENEQVPKHIAGNASKVQANNFTIIVAALEKFTIPDGKFFSVQIMEKNGGRHLSLKVNNNKIIKAIVLPDIR